MTKLLEFPEKRSNITWLEAMNSMIRDADEHTKNKKVGNLLIISEDKDDYSFGVLNTNNIRSMLGTLECIKQYFISTLQEIVESDFEDDDI